MFGVFEELTNGLNKGSSMVFHKNLFKTRRAAKLEMMFFRAALASQLEIFDVNFTEALQSEV
jgi:hypothetical protein